MASSAKQSGSRWWSGLFAPRRLPVPYEVACPCGGCVRGYRRRRPQVIPCPACQKPVFVFPRSPWDANVTAPAGTTSTPLSPARWFWRTVRMPVIAGAATLAGFVVVFAALLPFLIRPPATNQPPAMPAAQMTDRLDAGRKALSEGAFNVAVREYNAAVELRDRQPDLLTPKQSRELSQLQRQADLLARLHNQPLQEVLAEAVRTRSDEEWQGRFETAHKGGAILFDDVVRHDPASKRLVLSCFEVKAGNEKAIVALDDLKILQALPLDPPPRLIFGGRLKSIAREEGGIWVIRFEPDSGVLLTDLDAVTACWPVSPDDDVLRTLRRQQDWLRDLPAQRPAP
jgi:hypothetical protein